MRTIRVRYLGQTNYKPSRLVADDGEGHRLVMSYSEAENIADEWKQARRWKADRSGPDISPERVVATAFRRRMEWDTVGGRLIGGRHGHITYFNFEESWI